jgi:N-acyl-D-amino-acid deacylase
MHANERARMKRINFIGVVSRSLLCLLVASSSLGSDSENTAGTNVLTRCSPGLARILDTDAEIDAAPLYDFLIRNGRIIDGSGNPWYWGDVAINGDRIAAIGRLERANAKHVIDASGMFVAPGFIDMLGQSEGALLIDNRAQSKLSQGITTEITGEGDSVAPLDGLAVAGLNNFFSRYQLSVDWTTFDGYFRRLEKQGSALNVGSYVGAARVREIVIGNDARTPSPEELDKMKLLVRQAMEDGALGLSTALIYPPGAYAKTEELIELAKVASQYGGVYATHMRSEGVNERAALEETFRIGREAHIPIQIFHLKVSGKSRWGSMPSVVAMIQEARDSGLDVAANMYPYLAGGTGLTTALPPWVADGGSDKLFERLRNPQIRRRISNEIATNHGEWENNFLNAGGGSGVLIAAVNNPELKKYEGKTVAQVAKAQRQPVLDALFDLILADHGRTWAIYFLASETDLQYGLKQPFTSIGVDANETTIGGRFPANGHPRAFGTMPKFLGHYVRDLHLVSLEEAIRKITSLPAQRVHLVARGQLIPGFFADVTVFDPLKLNDNATYIDPIKLSAGINYVFVNGQLEYDGGNLTGVTAGCALRGPGWKSSK